jgi:hydroxyethylthiazole kinase
MTEWFLPRQQQVPLIHSLTNKVTINDCANSVLAAGGTVSMAENFAEVAELQRHADALVINLGVLRNDNLPTLIKAGVAANDAQHPVIFDPVGVGGTTFRNDATKTLASTVKLDIIRGNVSEILAFDGQKGTTRGVDASVTELITQNNRQKGIEIATSVAQKHQMVVVISGPIDVISDGRITVTIANGDEMMPRLIGTGDMLSHVIAVWAAQYPQEQLLATVNAVVSFNIAGERAAKQARELGGGQGMFQYLLRDQLEQLSDTKRIQEARIEVIK